jgi:hypothetical protein
LLVWVGPVFAGPGLGLCCGLLGLCLALRVPVVPALALRVVAWWGLALRGLAAGLWSARVAAGWCCGAAGARAAGVWEPNIRIGS